MKTFNTISQVFEFLADFMGTIVALGIVCGLILTIMYVAYLNVMQWAADLSAHFAEQRRLAKAGKRCEKLERRLAKMDV